MPEQREQNDDRKRDSQHPEKKTSAHDVAPYIARGVSTRSFQVPSRSAPPSAAARLAAKAPKRSAAVNQKERCAAPRRALSAPTFASVTTSSTRFVASASLMPVRAATTC